MAKVYKGVFNWHGGVHTLWTSAPTEQAAKGKFMTRLATMLEVDRIVVCGYYSNNVDNRKITHERG